MQVYRPAEFTADRPWGAIEIERMEGASIKLYWTDQPYVWHSNDGPEVFVVLSGCVMMHTRSSAGERSFRLEAGDVFHAVQGDEHKAEPLGEARVLVIERPGSV